MDQQENSPDVTQAGAPCESCGFPLATDQRYCLNCGGRRSGPRLDYIKYLAAEGPAAASHPAVGGQAGPSVTGPRRDASPVLAVGGIALLGLMLLIGVLVGRGDDPATPEPAVVQVTGTTPSTTTAAAAAPPADASSLSAKKAKGAGGEEVVEASTEDLQALESASGEDYSEASKKLPDTIATPGEAPPEDNAKPGGGSSGTVVK